MHRCVVAVALSALALLGQASSALAQTAAAAQGSAPRTVLVVGDSLSAEYGIKRGTGWVPLLSARISEQYPKFQVVNASISGDTTSGGVARLPALLRQHAPAVVVLELGANDALRGLPLPELRRNLARMIGASRHVGARVLLVGMRMPPNLGPDYTRGFEQTYRDLAALFDVELLPFLLEPVAADRGNFMDDNLHVNVGIRAPFFRRNLANYCFAINAGSGVTCSWTNVICFSCARLSTNSPSRRKKFVIENSRACSVSLPASSLANPGCR